jgi:hypothetical protein
MLAIDSIGGLDNDFKSPKTFFNDVQGNRFSFTIFNDSAFDEPYSKPVLLYEDGEQVTDQSILRELAPPSRFRAGDNTVCYFRIEEVCFRHNHKLFCLQWAWGEKSFAIKVKAKMSREASQLAALARGSTKVAGKKRKQPSEKNTAGSASRAGSRSSTRINTVSKKKQRVADPLTGIASVHTVVEQNEWDSSACGMLNKLSWQRIGCEQTLGLDGQMVSDPCKPIFRCSQCFQCWSSSDLHPKTHSATCPVLCLISLCPSYDANNFDTSTLGLGVKASPSDASKIATPSLMVPPSFSRTPSVGIDIFGFSLPNTPMTMPDLSPCATKTASVEGPLASAAGPIVPKQMREVLSKLALEAQCQVRAVEDDRVTEKALREWAEEEEKKGLGMQMILLTPRRSSSNNWTNQIPDGDLENELDIDGAADFVDAPVVKSEA